MTATLAYQLEANGLTAQALADSVMKALKKENN